MSSLLSELMTSGGWMLHAGRAIHASTFNESLTTAERISRAGWVITQPLHHKAGELQCEHDRFAGARKTTDKVIFSDIVDDVGNGALLGRIN